MDQELRIENFFLRAAGHRLAAQWIGSPGPGAVLVFLHEGLGSIGQWRDFPASLCRAVGLPGLVYDRCGYGGSDPLTGSRTVEYLHEEAFTSLPQVLETCGVKKAIFIGHSDGGSIALLFGAVHPEKTTGIITEAAHVFVEDVTVAGIRETVAAWHQGGLKEKLARYQGSNTEGAFRGWSETWLSPEFRNWNLEEYLPAITAPLLAIQGQDDPYGTPDQVRAIVEQAGGKARGLLIADCGHIPHHQAREKVLAEMASFIQGLS